MAVFLSQMKTCSRCNETKPIDAFPKQRTYCKKCWQKQCKPAVKRWMEKHPEKCRAYTKKWQRANPEKRKEYKSKYLKINQEKINEAGRDYRRRNGEIKRAHEAVKYALQTGKLKREPCFCCGNEEALAHHPSYARDMRLSVVWLCRLHHAEVHA